MSAADSRGMVASFVREVIRGGYSTSITAIDADAADFLDRQGTYVLVIQNAAAPGQYIVSPRVRR